MEFKSWLLSEMPIQNLHVVGNWESPKKYGWDDISKKIITSPKGIEKIKKRWTLARHNFDIYLLKNPKVHKYVNYGRTNPVFVKTNLGLDINPDPDAVAVIYTQNKGADRVPMTGWALAHRLGHALAFNDNRPNFWYSEIYTPILRKFKQLLSVYGMSSWDRSNNYDYDRKKEISDEKKVVQIAYAIGTMKSARDRNLSRFPEFVHELMAQYMLTGDIKFKPLPEKILVGHAWGRPQHRSISADDAHYNQYIVDEIAEFAKYIFDELLDDAVGGIYIM